MIIRKEDYIELLVDNLAYGGEGIARVDGFVIFVRGAVPGDRIIARVFKKRKGYANASIVEMLDPSPDRVNAPCPYSGHCGGCNYQHLDYAKQLFYKREHVIDAMKRLGSFKNVKVHETIPSDDKFEYRNKMEFSFSDRKWILPEDFIKTEENRGLALGLHVPGTFHKVIDIEACLLQHNDGNSILRTVKEYALKSGVPAYGLKSHKGFWRFLTLRYSRSFNEWMVNIITSEKNPDLLIPLVDKLRQDNSNISTIINNISRKKAAIAVGDEEIILSGEGYIKEMLGEYNFHVSANSFFQTNSSSAEKLYGKVLEYAELKGNESVLDLYCGTGTIPVFLSKHAGEITGMEISESAVRDAEYNCRINNVNNCSFILGDIKEKIPELNFTPDLLIIDPPRTGMHKDVIKVIMEMGTEKIVYVSCNPATMARDVGSMSEKYNIEEIQPVDMFPHTYHIEAVAKLVLK